MFVCKGKEGKSEMRGGEWNKNSERVMETCMTGGVTWPTRFLANSLPSRSLALTLEICTKISFLQQHPLHDTKRKKYRKKNWERKKENAPAVACLRRVRKRTSGSPTFFHLQRANASWHRWGCGEKGLGVSAMRVVPRFFCFHRVATCQLCGHVVDNQKEICSKKNVFQI